MEQICNVLESLLECLGSFFGYILGPLGCFRKGRGSLLGHLREVSGGQAGFGMTSYGDWPLVPESIIIQGRRPPPLYVL